MTMMICPDKMLARQGGLQITRIDATMVAECCSWCCRPPQLDLVAQEANLGDCQSIERRRCVSARVSETINYIQEFKPCPSVDQRDTSNVRT